MQDAVRIMYVAPRYHTNQVPVMHGWHEMGIAVKFLAQFEGVSEVHDYVDFERMRQSVLSRILYKFVDRRYPPDVAETKKMSVFIPGFFSLVRNIREFKPTLIIVRERTVTNFLVKYAAYLAGCKKIILYIQQPVYGNKKKVGMIKRLLRRIMFPQVVFSPVLYKDSRENLTEEMQPGKEASYFVPLVCERPAQQKAKNYCQGGVLRILDVGKYRAYKNHFFLVDAVACLKHRKDVAVTIIGQLSNTAEKEYFEKLKQYIQDKQVGNLIDVRTNVPFGKMEAIYNEHDILVLPSKNESAGMVILEAMGLGLCVLSSIHCGLASYIDEYQCGYSFAIDDPQKLAAIIESLADDKSKVAETGQYAVETVERHFCFNNYLEALDVLTRREFGIHLAPDTDR